MTEHMLSSLRDRIKSNNVILVLGAGVGLGASSGSAVAGWKGLLEHGLQRCADVVPGVRLSWLERSREQLREAFENNEVDEIVAIGSAIERKLNRESGEFSLWLRDTVGTLPLKDRSLIDAIVSVGCPILTTNYDTLVEQVTGYSTVTLEEPNRVLGALRGEEKSVVHLHGVWSRPATIALGSDSYVRVQNSASLQSIQRSIATSHSLLFIGCGGGLNDPNLGSLFRWYRETFKGELETRHYRLARSSEVQDITQQHESGDRVMVIPFGDEHSALPAFLGSLHGAPPSGDKQKKVDLINEDDTLDDLARRRPVLWEYLYFSKVLSAELATRQDLKRTYARRLHFPSSARLFGDSRAMFSWVSAKLGLLTHVTEGLARLMNEDLQQSFGAEGEHGDAELLRHCAMRVAAAYQCLLEWSLEFVGVVPPSEQLATLLDLTSQFSNGTIEGIEKFSQDIVVGLRDAIEDPHTERTIRISLVLAVQDGLPEALEAEFRRVRAALGLVS